MISCLVATKEARWGAYVATEEQLQNKEQPTYLATYEYPSQVWKAIAEKFLKEGESDGFTDYGTFWAKVREAGIEVPQTDDMPHRQKQKAEV